MPFTIALKTISALTQICLFALTVLIPPLAEGATIIDSSQPPEGGTLAAEGPLRLDYVFRGTEYPASQSLNAIFREHVNDIPTDTANSFRRPDSFRIDVSVEISADRTSVSILSFRYLDTNVSLFVSDEFDLGFSGRVPYTAEVNEFRYSLGVFTTPLGIDGRFDGGFQPSSATLGGVSEMLGVESAFSLTANTETRIRGKFTAASDPLETTLVITVTAGEPDGLIRQEQFNGQNLKLFATADSNSPTFVPEPSSFILGLAALAIVGTRRIRLSKLRRISQADERGQSRRKGSGEKS